MSHDSNSALASKTQSEAEVNLFDKWGCSPEVLAEDGVHEERGAALDEAAPDVAGEVQVALLRAGRKERATETNSGR